MLAALALALAFAHAARRAISLRSAVGADAAVLFETRGLPGGAFLLGLRWTAVTFAVADPAHPVLREGRKGRAAYQ